MANLPMTLDLPVMGRVLPRGQQWNDVPGEDEARSDPGMDRYSYLAWERGEPDPDYDLDEVEFDHPLPASLSGDWQAEPDLAVWVNGEPLEVYLFKHNDRLPSADVLALLARVDAHLARQYVPQDQLEQGEPWDLVTAHGVTQRDRRPRRQREGVVETLIDSVPRDCWAWCPSDCRGHAPMRIWAVHFIKPRKRSTHSALRPHELIRLYRKEVA